MAKHAREVFLSGQRGFKLNIEPAFGSLRRARHETRNVNIEEKQNGNARMEPRSQVLSGETANCKL
jgi:hypothetical protein